MDVNPNDRSRYDPRAAVLEIFAREFGGEPEFLVRAPGRVNLIGEHTDYNDGFVLPMAIERAVWIALRRRDDTMVDVWSVDFDKDASFDAAAPEHGGPSWIEYLKGTAWALGEAGHRLRGWAGAMASDVPIGAGLSSSAAIELATARAFHATSGFEWDAPQMALIAQRAENRWVGVNCGIMDQMISATGVEGHAVLIDCRSLELTPVPLPAGTSVVILDTATRRGLVDSAYNERRAQCQAAADHFGVRALRDVRLPALDVRQIELDPVVAKRALHVVSENERTLAAADAMRAGDAATLGELMNASHESLRDDFEVSSDALDTIVEIAREQDGCYGARMTGAGFGGCAVALVRADAADAFASAVAAAYAVRTGLTPAVYVTGAARGASSA
ncbi:MAG TPA: galactokinase [Longimicrobiales bacterium]